MGAIRFVRAGTTPLYLNPRDCSRYALAPVPAGTDDPSGYSNLNANGDSDPIPVGQYSEMIVTLYSDTTCSAGLQVFTGPTPTGPWVAVGSVSVNPSLATPVAVQVTPAGTHVGFLKVTTSSYVSGNPRATLDGITKVGRGTP